MKCIPALVSVALSAPLLAQSNVDPAHKFAWGENCGWTNWLDANGGADGVVINATFLQGFAWGETIGWINFGDGTPGGVTAYTNATGADHGVNILANSDLAGLAWGETVGWINFDTAAAIGPQRARFDAIAGRLRGYAWGENIGWLNLDDIAHYVARKCYPDCNDDGTLNLSDFGCFQTKFALGNLYADCNNDGLLNLSDFGCFQTKFALGCP
ncbi:MAG: EF-hand domain-containing protein [Phycisphaerales bacterium]|nr:EF-hand domain-containing protein [Phycisphaerales bacterium]